MPEPVYETLTKSGVLTTDALADGQRILLPKEWPEGENSLGGRQNTLLWLSQRQYEEIVNTRHTNIAVGSFESGLQGVQDITQMLGGLLSQVSESAGSAAANTKDVTEIEAAVDWGTYTLTYNGKKVRVRTIEAENTFATYTILANPENPLILQVELHPIALGTSALAGLGQMKTLTGYRVSVITMP